MDVCIEGGANIGYLKKGVPATTGCVQGGKCTQDVQVP